MLFNEQMIVSTKLKRAHQAGQSPGTLHPDKVKG